MLSDLECNYSMLEYGIYFTIAFVCSVIVTGLVAILMRRYGVIDRAPGARSRKIHTRSTPLGGGLAVYTVFFGIAGIVWLSHGEFRTTFNSMTLVGLSLGSLFLMIGGILDDKFTLRPRYQIIAPILASVVMVVLGNAPGVFSSPFGGVVDLTHITIMIEPAIHIVLFADALVFLWLFGMMFTTKFLDGLDGLVSGIVTIAAFVIYAVSIQPQWSDPNVALLSLIFAGTLLGFLVWNFNPAKIFLGEGGSLMTGFILGSLAIISKSKIAITFMVIGIPMIDVVRVMVMRVIKKRPVYIGDREHLHYRLIESGLSHRQAVLLLYAISLLFGMTALFIQAEHQLIALLFIFVLMLLIGLWLSKKDHTSS